MCIIIIILINVATQEGFAHALLSLTNATKDPDYCFKNSRSRTRRGMFFRNSDLSADTICNNDKKDGHISSKQGSLCVTTFGTPSNPCVTYEEGRKQFVSSLWKTCAGMTLNQNFYCLKDATAIETIESQMNDDPITSHSNILKLDSVSRIAKIYDDGASTYDDYYSESIVSRSLDFATLRQSLLNYAQGSVLELGVGTGLNLQYYPEDKTSIGGQEAITAFCGIDISSGMLSRAKKRIDTLSRPDSHSVFSKLSCQHSNCSDKGKVKDNNAIDLKIADATHLPFDDNSYDTVVDTFSLCVFEQPVVVLQEARRVLKPGGRLLLLEHEESILGKVMRPTRSVASASDIAKTCRYNDNVRSLLNEAGFSKFLSDEPKAGGFFRQVVAIKD